MFDWCKAIENVLRRAGVPLTRNQIRRAMGHRTAQPLLDEGLRYLADHEMVYDEGPDGTVLWIHTSEATRARLRGN